MKHSQLSHSGQGKNKLLNKIYFLLLPLQIYLQNDRERNFKCRILELLGVLRWNGVAREQGLPFLSSVPLPFLRLALSEQPHMQALGYYGLQVLQPLSTCPANSCTEATFLSQTSHTDSEVGPGKMGLGEVSRPRRQDQAQPSMQRVLVTQPPGAWSRGEVAMV